MLGVGEASAPGCSLQRQLRLSAEGSRSRTGTVAAAACPSRGHSSASKGLRELVLPHLRPEERSRSWAGGTPRGPLPSVWLQQGASSRQRPAGKDRDVPLGDRCLHEGWATKAKAFLKTHL